MRMQMQMRFMLAALPLLLLPSGCAPRAADPVGAPSTAPTARPTPLPMLEPPMVPAAPAGERVAWAAEELAIKGENAAALAGYRAAWEGGDRDPRNAYNAACVAVRLGERAEGLTWLTRAADGGWCDGAHAKNDPDLAPLCEGADASTFAALVKRAASNAASAECNDSELNAIQIADQADRADLVPGKADPERRKGIHARDSARRTRVAELVAAGRVRTKGDWFAAAMVYQHGDTLADYERARQYAYESAKLGNRAGLWLTAAAWDRWLLMAGYPQRYGTQYTCKPTCVLKPFDESITDDERKRWNCPTLAEAKARTFE